MFAETRGMTTEMAGKKTVVLFVNNVRERDRQVPLSSFYLYTTPMVVYFSKVLFNPCCGCDGIV